MKTFCTSAGVGLLEPSGRICALILLRESYSHKRAPTPRGNVLLKLYRGQREKESPLRMLAPVLNYSKALKWLIHFSRVGRWPVTKEKKTFI